MGNESGNGTATEDSTERAGNGTGSEILGARIARAAKQGLEGLGA